MLYAPEFWVAISFFAFVGLPIKMGVPSLIKVMDDRADAVRKGSTRRGCARGGTCRRLPAQAARGRRGQGDHQEARREAGRKAESARSLGQLERRTHCRG